MRKKKSKSIGVVIVIISFYCSFISPIEASVIKGHIIDSETNESMAGATVIIKNTAYTGVSDEKGNYFIQNVKPGNYTLSVKYVGYKSPESTVNITSDSIWVVDFSLTNSHKIREVLVTGKSNKESDGNARDIEKNSDNIVNVVSARTIEKSPDITVANVAQRISGVSLDRTAQGDGRYVIIRGMDARYNNTLINGVKIPSPNSKDRFVPLDVIPAELLQRMEISKSLRPDMEGDAIGGTVNLVMKDAPDTTYFKANLSTGYNQLFIDSTFRHYDKGSIGSDPYQQHGASYSAQDTDFSRKIFDYQKNHPLPNLLAGLAVGRRFFKNKLGILVAGSYQNLYRGASSKYWFTGIDVGNNPSQLEYFQRLYSTHQIRSGINLKIDYVFNPKHKISLYNVYLNMQDYEQRHTLDTIIQINSTSASNSVLDRSKTQLQSIYNSTLQGIHTLHRNVLADWSLVYSNAVGSNPDWTEMQVDYSYNLVNAPPYLNSIYHIFQKNTDQDLAAYANVSYTPKIFGKKIEFKAGGLSRFKTRTNYYNHYQLLPGSKTTGVAVPFTGIDDAAYYVYNPLGTPIYGQNNYTASENINAAYGQAKIQFGHLIVLAGMRVEFTNQSFHINNSSPVIGNSTVNITYNDPLASLNMHYEITSKSNLRFSFFQGISRPNFYELVPYQIKGEYFTEAGNPKLQHTTSNNFDLKYEIYPNAKDFFSAGIFYKAISNPIELFYNVYGTNAIGKTPDQLANLKAVPLASYTIMPFNFGNCTNYGLELSAIKFFGAIGISANYTFTSSIITSVKIENDSAIQKTVSVLQNRPLQGQSKHIGNASLLYRNKAMGLNLQLSLVYTGRRIVQVSPYYNLDYYQKDLALLDFSGDKTIFKNFVIFCKINNLLNSPYKVELANGLLVQEDYYSTNYQLGIRYSL